MTFIIFLAWIIGAVCLGVVVWAIAQHFLQFYPKNNVGEVAWNQFFHAARGSIIKLAGLVCAVAGALIASFFFLLIFNFIPRQTVQVPVYVDRFITKEVVRDAPAPSASRPSEAKAGSKTFTTDSRIQNAPCKGGWYRRQVTNIRDDERVLLPNGCRITVQATRGAILVVDWDDQRAPPLRMVPIQEAAFHIHGGYITADSGTADVFLFLEPTLNGD